MKLDPYCLVSVVIVFVVVLLVVFVVVDFSL